MSGNSATVVGNLTRDPELKFTNSGQAMVKFSVAHNHRYPSKDGGDWNEKVSFIDVTAWGRIAENAAESLRKGDRVIVLGRLDLNQWETDAGEKRSRLEIVAESIGADLTFATAAISKVESGGGGGARQAKPAASKPATDWDEEPF